MWKILGAAVVALSLGACVDPLTLNVATPQQAVVAINGYNAAAVTATNYLKLPLCGSPPCRTQPVSQSVYTALKAGRAARNTILTTLQANNAVPISAITALQAAYATISLIPQQ